MRPYGHRPGIMAFVKGTLSRPLWAALFGLCLLVLLWALWVSLEPNPRQFLDLDVYRLGVQVVWTDVDLYNVRLGPAVTGQLMPFSYPPFAAIVLSPIGLLPLAVSAVLMVTFSLGCLAVTVYVVLRKVWPALGQSGWIGVTAVAMPLLVMLEPIQETLRFGQINLLLMAMVALDCLVEKPRWPRGLLIGVAAAIKLTPAAFVLFLLLRKDFRATAVAVLTGVAATALAWLVLPDDSRSYWLGGMGGVTEINGSHFATNQSLRGALARFGFVAPVELVLWAVLGIGVLAVTVLAMRKALRAGDVVVAMLANAGCAVLLSPTSWSHHWVWAGLAGVVMVARLVRYGGWGRLVALLATAVVFLVGAHNRMPVGGDFELAWTPWQHLLGDSYVLVGVVLLVVLALGRFGEGDLVPVGSGVGEREQPESLVGDGGGVHAR